MTNQNPEQIARDNIDRQLLGCGWLVQPKTKINLSAGILLRNNTWHAYEVKLELNEPGTLDFKL